MNKEELEKELTIKVKRLEDDCKAYNFTQHTLQEKIKELEEKNERLKGDLELWESGACRATNLDKCGVVKKLEAQIEKMKCCANCKHSRTEYEHCKTDKHEKWEIKEK